MRVAALSAVVQFGQLKEVMLNDCKGITPNDMVELTEQLHRDRIHSTFCFVERGPLLLGAIRLAKEMGWWDGKSAVMSRRRWRCTSLFDL